MLPVPPYKNGRHLLLAALCCFQLTKCLICDKKTIIIIGLLQKLTKCATKCAEDFNDKQQLPGPSKKFKAMIWMQRKFSTTMPINLLKVTQGMCLTKTSKSMEAQQSEFSCVLIKKHN